MADHLRCLDPDATNQEPALSSIEIADQLRTMLHAHPSEAAVDWVAFNLSIRGEILPGYTTMSLDQLLERSARLERIADRHTDNPLVAHNSPRHLLALAAGDGGQTLAAMPITSDDPRVLNIEWQGCYFHLQRQLSQSGHAQSIDQLPTLTEYIAALNAAINHGYIAKAKPAPNQHTPRLEFTNLDDIPSHTRFDWITYPWTRSPASDSRR